MKVKSIRAREILDSRGIPTISAKIELEDGTVATGEVPSGASTGSTEVLELRDGDKGRYFGKGVLKAVDRVNNQIAKEIVGREFNSQKEFDQTLIDLDGTELKTRLGGNSILSVSMAFCRASAKSMGLELYEYFATIYWGENYNKRALEMPEPLILIMEGGQHGNWATDIQEFMVVPKKSEFADFSEMLRAGAEIFKATHDILVDKGYAATVGFEGAFAPLELSSNSEAIEIILQGVEKAGYHPGTQIGLALDVASSEFYDTETHRYNLKSEGLSLSSDDWMDLQAKWYSKYPMVSVEDVMHEEDWDAWVKFMNKLGHSVQVAKKMEGRLQVVGDDLLTTNVKRIQKAIDLGAANTVLIKLNQIGSVTETLDAIRLAESAGLNNIISHRGGETNDDMIADLVVGTSAQQSKFGGPDRGERLAKYNRLLEIEQAII